MINARSPRKMIIFLICTDYIVGFTVTNSFSIYKPSNPPRSHHKIYFWNQLVVYLSKDIFKRISKAGEVYFIIVQRKICVEWHWKSLKLHGHCCSNTSIDLVQIFWKLSALFSFWSVNLQCFFLFKHEVFLHILNHDFLSILLENFKHDINGL